MRIFRIFLNAALRKKMGIMVLVSFFVFGLLLSGGGLIQIYNFSNEILFNDISNASKGLNFFLDSKITDSRRIALILSTEHDLVAGIKNKDFATLSSFIEKFSQLYPGSYVTVTDSSGNVLARSNNPAEKGDNLSDLPEVASALSGKVESGIAKGHTTGLSVRSGAPVRDEKGKIIGTISTGFKIAGTKDISNQIRDNLGVEVAFFDGDKMVSTSIKNNELPFFDKFFNSSIYGSVLKDGKPVDYGTPKNISEMYNFIKEVLFGKPYFAYYYPIEDANGKILGMYFIAKDTAFYNNMLKRFTIVQFALNITAIIIGIILLLLSMEFFFMRPIGLLVKDIKRVASGDLSQPLNPVYNDELGVVVRAVESIRSNFINVIGKINFAIRDLVNTSDELMSVSSLVATSSSDVSNLSEINAKGAMDLSNISSKLNEDKDILLRSIQGISKGVEDQAITASNIAQNINKIAKSIETFGDKLKVVTDILQETNIKIKDMNKEAYEKIPIVDEIVNAMSSVTDIFNNIKTNSEKIRSAFVPLQTIANQIQLWSSNAIIETAKLGDQGKGFEVIIEEIRNLSEKLLNTTNDILINLSEGFNSSDGSKINFNKQDENIDIIKKYFSSIENSAIILANNVNDLSTKIEKIKEDASGLLSSKDIKNIETSLANLAALAEEDLSNIHEINRASLDVQRAIENVAEISKDGVSSTKNISEKANEQLTEANKMEEVSNVIKIKSNELEDEVRKFKI